MRKTIGGKYINYNIIPHTFIGIEQTPTNLIHTFEFLYEIEITCITEKLHG